MKNAAIDNMKARISQLHKTELQWSLIPNFVPFNGELIVFDPDDKYAYARLKIGDGYTLLSDLPFFVDSATTNFITEHFDTIVDAGRITDYDK